MPIFSETISIQINKIKNDPKALEEYILNNLKNEIPTEIFKALQTILNNFKRFQVEKDSGILTGFKKYVNKEKEIKLETNILNLSNQILNIIEKNKSQINKFYFRKYVYQLDESKIRLFVESKGGTQNPINLIDANFVKDLESGRQLRGKKFYNLDFKKNNTFLMDRIREELRFAGSKGVLIENSTFEYFNLITSPLTIDLEDPFNLQCAKLIEKVWLNYGSKSGEIDSIDKFRKSGELRILVHCLKLNPETLIHIYSSDKDIYETIRGFRDIFKFKTEKFINYKQFETLRLPGMNNLLFKNVFMFRIIKFRTKIVNRIRLIPLRNDQLEAVNLNLETKKRVTH